MTQLLPNCPWTKVIDPASERWPFNTMRIVYSFYQRSDMLLPSRLARELKTITAMAKIYCHNRHNFPKGSLCRDCTEFLEYAEQRLSHCPFKGQKPTCGKCPIHCYKQSMQTAAKQIMRYSGPRMLWNHPLMAFFHLLDSKRRVPDCPKNSEK